MNRLLSRKFVFSTMTATSILLILLIGTINIVNLINTNNMAWNSLEMISRFSQEAQMAPEGRPEKPEERPGQEPPNRIGRNAYDTYMASNFFVVEYSADGEITNVDVSRTSKYSEEDAVQMAAEAVASGKSEGRDSKCIFRKQTNQETGEYAVYFLDKSANNRMVLSVFIASLLVGSVCWLLMLLITVLLSRRATKPIAESFEKQKQFITDAGHEYKTPLAIIQSNADAMELHMGENKWLTNIKKQVVRLTGLTQDMLLLAKMDERDIEVRKETVNVSEMVKNQLEALDLQIGQHGMELKNEIEKNVMTKCNRDDMDKVIGILLDNALKYGREGGYMDVRLTNGAKSMILSVENECEELPDVPPEKLFERFYRWDSSRNQEKGGSGIGLSIAKAIVDSYGGKISCVYPGENAIRFTVEV